MNRGVSSVVAPILIVVIVVVGAGIFLSVYLRSVRDIASRDLPLCTGIDLKVNLCLGFLAGVELPQGGTLDQNGIYFVVERLPGGGDEIRDLRFKITDSEGNFHSERPFNVSRTGINTVYVRFAEHSTIEAATKPINYYPCNVTVSAVVGKSNTVCTPTREVISCSLYDSGNPSAIPPTAPQVIPIPNCF